MFMKHSQITPVRLSAVLEAAEAAARAIPPAFPLDATVAVNPFLGQTGEDLAAAAARLGRVAGVRVTRTGAEYATAIRDGRINEDDLAEALAAAPSPLKPADTTALCLAAERMGDGPEPSALPTVADLAAEETGIDWPALIDKCIGLWAAGQFDRGQALWSPAPGNEAFAAWRAWAMHDLTPEIAGLKGFCAHVAAAPDTAERAILFRRRGAGHHRCRRRDRFPPPVHEHGRLVAACPLAAVAGGTGGRDRPHHGRSARHPPDLGRGAVGPRPAGRRPLGRHRCRPCRAGLAGCRRGRARHPAGRGGSRPPAPPDGRP